MRLLRVVCFFVCLAVAACAGGEKDAPYPMPPADEAAHFQSLTGQIASDLGVKPPVTLILAKKQAIGLGSPAYVIAIGKLPTPAPDMAQYPHFMFASSHFVTGTTELAHKFILAHEVCHVKFGHTSNRNFSIGHNEVEANRCACLYLGKEQCVTAIMDLAAYTNWYNLRGQSRYIVERSVSKYYEMPSNW